jgi:AP-1 complex subunit beta-1
MAVNRIRGAFATPRKGETFELRAGLVSQYAYERKEAIQKTIMSMTLGKDVSSLFPDVLKNIATADLDQKKLVYLYLMSDIPRTHLRSMLTISEGTMPNHILTSVSLP